MQIRHDNNIFDQDKKDLQKQLELFTTTIEDIQSQDPLLISQHIEKNDLNEKLQEIQQQYHDMVMTIASTDELDQKKKSLKKKNI
jgi:cob(I)alamin adenosyltransferase